MFELKFIPALALLFCAGFGSCSSPPDLQRAEQFPFAPNRAVEGCAGYFEAQSFPIGDSLDRWKSDLHAKAFFRYGQKYSAQIFGPLTMGKDTLPWTTDTLNYGPGDIHYRSWYYNDSLSSWDSSQAWHVIDEHLGIFSDTLRSPHNFIFSHDWISKSQGFKLFYEYPGVDSLWVSITSFSSDQKVFINGRIPANGTYYLSPFLLKDIPVHSKISIDLSAQTANLLQHSGRWYIFRSTVSPRLTTYLNP
ncbi:MAG TPA: hypothetical protein VGM92_14535 [Candidatus Kapabacteria bacterium]